MDQTPLLPPVSARLFDILRSLDGNVAEWVTEDLLSIHDDLVKEEADRQLTREVVQALVDYIAYKNSATAVPEVYYGNGGLSYAQCIALAKSINIEPKP